MGIELSRALSPRSIVRANVQVTTGGDRVLGGVRYDPARRRVEFVPVAGEMRADLEYQLVVTPGLLAWDGVPLEQGIVQRFRTSTAAYVSPPPARTPTLSGHVAPLLRARCATAGCHAPPEPVMGLDLSSADAIVRTAVGVPSRERPPSLAAGSERTDPHWGSLLRIDPPTAEGAPGAAYSYLFYKVAGEGPILGTRMPPPDAPALTLDERALVADWIARGAPAD